ncbi:hypothetical protein NEF87_003837 [Candidatus Lokiarchaeum ossiferum]|uniref:Uncharacterized protein n=1 Tax=Candidatus Lokiarchaeum ossiferum TaxID=2951803 RepID=A0ABY6HVK3_9ARCH|nr:hypothetical protein NEF87_003837 [Candidatus Lokiarchaeum sp. B-35]
MDDKKEYYESKKLAQAFIAKLSEEIKIPKRIYDALLPLGQNLVAVIPGDSKKLSFFLTNASRVLFVKLILDKSSLNESFFTSLRKTLKELDLTNLFSTGICFKDEICVWEGVFEDTDAKFDIIKEKMSSITHVKKPFFERIELEE